MSTLRLLVVFAAYYVAGRVGLALDPVAGFASLVWAPAGIGVAAAFLWGTRIWPAVAGGALVVHLIAGASGSTALVIAAGNTAEAVVAGHLLYRMRVRPSLDRLGDVFAFVIVGGALASMVSATVGVLALWHAGTIHPPNLTPTWLAWSLGDLMGALVVGTTLLVWARSTPLQPRHPARVVEVILLLGTTVIGSIAILEGIERSDLMPSQLYLLFPLALWAALRFGPRGAVTTTLLMSAITIRMTVAGRGPFAEGDLWRGLVHLQLLLATVGVTGLVTAAVVTERARAVRAREQFMSITAHELRTPLSALRLQTGLLRRATEASDDRALDPNKLRGLASRIQRQAERLERLTEELTDLARIRSGKLKLSREEVDLVAVVHDVLDLFEERSPTQEFVVYVPETPVVGYWDRTRLEQILVNLIGNATTHAGKQPVTVSISRAGANRVRVQIQDEGPGLTARQQEEIFEPFSQLQDSDRITGLGLGLFIVRRLVEEHGGRTYLQSAPGKGSVFSVELPLGRPQADPSPAAALVGI